MKKYLLLSIIIVATTWDLKAQTAISATGVAPDASAMFDVSATDKGMLIPRVALTGTADATTILLPASSLLVYNTATAGGVTPGYYFNNGSTLSPS